VTLTECQIRSSDKVSYISPQRYTRRSSTAESRANIVFMIESVFRSRGFRRLHPGQPVDVEFNSK